MKIFLHDYGGYPFTWQLARELASRDHRVVYAYSSAEPGRSDFRGGESLPVNLVSIDVGRPLPRSALIARRAWSIDYGKAAAEEIRKFRPDVVLSANTPLDAQRALLTASRRCQSRFVYWLQDVLSVATRNIISKRSSLLGAVAGWYYGWRERSMLRGSDEVIAITEDFLPLLKGWGVNRANVHVIENWAPLDDMPVVPRHNEWAERHGLTGNCITIMYAGLLGMKHNPSLLGKLAERFRNQPEVRLVVVAEGTGVAALQAYLEEQQLNNVLLLPFQSYQDLPLALASADILFAILDSDGGYCVPSKVLTYLCAGRALLLSVPHDNLVSRIVSEALAGIVVDPADESVLWSAADQLVHDAELRRKLGDGGRQYAEDSFDITHLGNRFERLLGIEPSRRDAAIPRNARRKREAVVQPD